VEERKGGGGEGGRRGGTRRKRRDKKEEEEEDNNVDKHKMTVSLYAGDLNRIFSSFLTENIHYQVNPSSPVPAPANSQNPHASLEKYMCQV
jgi:hypothetical protein